MAEASCHNCTASFDRPRGQTKMCPECRTTHKWCGSCEESLTFDCFGPSKSKRSGGYQAYCRACASAKAAQWSKENSARRNANRRAKYTPERGRRNHVRRLYGLEPDQYSEMIREQDGKCAICGLVPEDTLHVDHDHGTGKVRELLCGRCNPALGGFKEDVALLQAAIQYLLKHQP